MYVYIHTRNYARAIARASFRSSLSRMCNALNQIHQGMPVESAGAPGPANPLGAALAPRGHCPGIPRPPPEKPRASPETPGDPRDAPVTFSGTTGRNLLGTTGGSRGRPPWAILRLPGTSVSPPKHLPKICKSI